MLCLLIAGEQATIYIMEDDQVKIPTLEKNSSFTVERQSSVSSNNNNSLNGVQSNGFSDISPSSQTVANTSNIDKNKRKPTSGSGRRKQSKEELKPLETLDRGIGDYVLVSGVTDKTTHF